MAQHKVFSAKVKSRAGMNWVHAIFALALCLLIQGAFAQSESKAFGTPEEAMNAFVQALRANDQAGLSAILGPGGDKLIRSGDEVADRRDRERFISAYSQARKLKPDGDNRLIVLIGNNEWPYPIPLVKSETGWFFDTQHGDDEILARRIGRNEYAALRVLAEIVDAQREYAALNRDDQGMPVYASKIVSGQGQHDGLYWPVGDTEPESPIGELVAAAAAEGYSNADAEPLAPYHGYLYRILAKQGKNAEGGVIDYVTNGRMTAGFAAIAWPARYGASGVMTFIVNENGQIFEKNMGPNTSEVAAGIDSFNPEDDWRPVAPPKP